uniref:SFRICE_015886 n=1 Tax=Spodoptera frugiperda TaxID=7108 RepID=A0A2H1VVY0_SPOFR
MCRGARAVLTAVYDIQPGHTKLYDYKLTVITYSIEGTDLDKTNLDTGSQWTMEWITSHTNKTLNLKTLNIVTHVLEFLVLSITSAVPYNLAPWSVPPRSTTPQSGAQKLLTHVLGCSIACPHVAGGAGNYFRGNSPTVASRGYTSEWHPGFPHDIFLHHLEKSHRKLSTKILQVLRVAGVAFDHPSIPGPQLNYVTTKDRARRTISPQSQGGVKVTEHLAQQPHTDRRHDWQRLRTLAHSRACATAREGLLSYLPHVHIDYDWQRLRSSSVARENCQNDLENLTGTHNTCYVRRKFTLKCRSGSTTKTMVTAGQVSVVSPNIIILRARSQRGSGYRIGVRASFQQDVTPMSMQVSEGDKFLTEFTSMAVACDSSDAADNIFRIRYFVA